MATKIYESDYIELIDGTLVYITPLKIKYFREFMEVFSKIKTSKSEDETLDYLMQCGAIMMKQYKPELATVELVEDSMTMEVLNHMIKISSGIDLEDRDDSQDSPKQDTQSNTWESLDLAKLESEVFLIGIWKDYEELEASLSIPELMATLNAKRDSEYEEKKFLAAMQGIDLGKGSEEEHDPWEAMKARVFSGGATSNPNDILSFQGQRAAKAGFGIGMGLSYDKWD